MEVLKRLFLHTKLFEWAYREGGREAFPLAQKDILETMRDDIDAQAEELAEKKLAALLSPVDMRQVVSVDTRTKSLLIGGERPDVGTITNIKSEVEFLLESELWKLMCETPKALAEKAMFTDDGILENQLIKGRAILYMLSTQQKILDTFKSLSTPTQSST